jgi:hypothetical protein
MIIWHDPAADPIELLLIEIACCRVVQVRVHRGANLILGQRVAVSRGDGAHATDELRARLSRERRQLPRRVGSLIAIFLNSSIATSLPHLLVRSTKTCTGSAVAPPRYGRLRS